MVILLPLMSIPSMTTISSLNDEKGCRSFCTSAFIGGQPWRMSSAKALKCLSFKVPYLISSTVMTSGISVPDSTVLMVMYMPGISLSPFLGLAWMDNLH